MNEEFELEKLRIKRNQEIFVLNKGLQVYFMFMIFAILGIVTKSMGLVPFIGLVLAGFVALIVSFLPFIAGSRRKV